MGEAGDDATFRLAAFKLSTPGEWFQFAGLFAWPLFTTVLIGLWHSTFQGGHVPRRCASQFDEPRLPDPFWQWQSSGLQAAVTSGCRTWPAKQPSSSNAAPNHCTLELTKPRVAQSLLEGAASRSSLPVLRVQKGHISQGLELGSGDCIPPKR